MAPKWNKWKKELMFQPGKKALFEKWLFLNISSVLLSSKDGELLILNSEDGLSIGMQTDYIAKLSLSWDFSYKILNTNENYVSIVIYNRLRVIDSLKNTPSWALKKMGYSRNVTPDLFFEEIGRRWKNTGVIPHEIGLVLGFPQKDVLGFMGILSLKCTGFCGWKIHGNPEPSLKRSRAYIAARKEAEYFLNIQSDQGRIACN